MAFPWPAPPASLKITVTETGFETRIFTGTGPTYGTDPTYADVRVYPVEAMVGEERIWLPKASTSRTKEGFALWTDQTTIRLPIEDPDHADWLVSALQMAIERAHSRANADEPPKPPRDLDVRFDHHGWTLQLPRDWHAKGAVAGAAAAGVLWLALLMVILLSVVPLPQAGDPTYVLSLVGTGGVSEVLVTMIAAWAGGLTYLLWLVATGGVSAVLLATIAAWTRRSAAPVEVACRGARLHVDGTVHDLAQLRFGGTAHVSFVSGDEERARLLAPSEAAASWIRNSLAYQARRTSRLPGEDVESAEADEALRSIRNAARDKES